MTKAYNFIFFFILFIFLIGCQQEEKVIITDVVTNEVTITIDQTQEFQVIDGFGAGITLEQKEYNELDANEKEKLAKALWSDLGATIVRIVANPEDEVNNNQIEQLKEAFARDINTGMLVVFSPPTSIKSNNQLKGGKITDYEEFSEFVADSIQRYEENGITISYIAPVNEPNNVGLGRSVEISPLELSKLIKVLGKVLDERDIGTKIIAPEVVSPTKGLNYATELLADVEAQGYIAALTFHQYGEEKQDSQVWSKVGELATENRLQLWQTETGLIPEENQGSNNNIAVEAAKNIHAALSGANASVWMFWLYYSAGNTGSLARIYGGEYTLLGQYWAMWHYSHFIPPGSIRISASSSTKDIFVTAYTTQDNKHVVVIINNGENNYDLSFSSPRGWTEEKHYKTTSTGNGEETGSIVIEAKSIHTLIFS